MTPIEKYLNNYPQLSLPIKEGESKSEEYIDITRYGIFPDTLIFPFKETGKEEANTFNTPAGKAEVLYLPDRQIFEYFIKVLAYKCEPVDIPKSTGAILISGINNWKKINDHKKEYSGNDWDEEFERFTSVKENYKDTVLLVSKGYYSNVSPNLIGLQEEYWIDKSKIIRTYHELTHFISRKLFIENKETLRDEIVADSIGIIAAFGYYDDLLAKKVLGIENETYRIGGRLENYVNNSMLESEAKRANKIIDLLKNYYLNKDLSKPFNILLKVEEEKVGIF